MSLFKLRSSSSGFRIDPRILSSFLLILGLLSGGGTAWAQAYKWKPVAIHGGGFVTGIQFHPSASGLMYCRTDIGGAYRWNPTNNTWVPLLDFFGYPNNEWSLISAESIGLDPQDSNRLYLTCGWLQTPSEILVSTNQGASFTQISSPFIIEANSDGRGNGERMGVDPNLGSVLFYGTRQDGLWESANYGASWTKVTSFPVTTTTNNIGLVFVEFIKSSGALGSPTPVIWVGVSQGGTNLYRSTDGGVTWTGITNGASSIYMPHRASQDGLGNMYITFCDAPGPNGVNSGVVRKFDLTTLTSIDVTPPTGQGGFAGVSVDRQNPNTVAVTTIDRWWPQNDIYRSTNGGTNWAATYNANAVDVSSAPWMGSGGPVIQGWTADIKIDPFNSNNIFFVTGGGVFSSFNFAATQPSWQFCSAGIEENAFCNVGLDLASPPSGGPQLLSVLGDMGGFAHYNLDVSPPDTNFFNPVDDSNYSIDFAEQNPDIAVRTYYASDRSGLLSTDAGATWAEFATNPAAAETNGPGMTVISADGNRLVWAVPGFAPFYSTNLGSSWNQSSGASLTPTYLWEQPYPFSDRVNPNKFYLYMPSTGVVHVSTNGGASFSAGGTMTTWGDSMHTAYGQEGDVWVAISDGLWRSTNSGAAFFKVPGVQAAHTVGFGRPNGGVGYPAVYLHGEINNTWGVYRSENQGTNWVRINDDQHQFGNIAQVIGDPKIYGRCYIAAGGRGILYGDLPNQPPFTPTGLTASPSNAAVALTWSPAAGADSYIVQRSTTGGGGYTPIASGLTTTSYLDSGLASGTTYYYVVAATNSYGVSSNSVEANATPMGPVPSPWQTQDIGTVGLTGNAFYGNGVFSLTGAGADIQGTSDAFRFAYVAATGNCAITARVVSLQPVNAWSKAGVMIRQSLAANDANAFIAMTPSNGVTWQYRSSAGGGTSWNNTGGLSAPYWVKLARTNNTFTGYCSPDGTNWTQQGTMTNAMSSNVYVGLALTSHNSSTLCTATFDNVTVPGWPTSPPPAAPTGLTATSGDAQVGLSWNSSSGATSYHVKCSTTSGGDYTTVATTASLAFTNTGLVNGTTRFYVVSALDTFGESTNSAEVSAHPISSSPVAINVTYGSGQLQFSWPADHAGWLLQSQTNSLAVGLSTNWVNVASSDQTNQMTLLLKAADGTVFFRLARP